MLVKGGESRVAGPAEDRLSFSLQVRGKLELAEDVGLLADCLLDDAQVSGALRGVVGAEAVLDDRALHAPVVDPIARSTQGRHHGVSRGLHLAGKQLRAAVGARSRVSREKIGIRISWRAVGLVRVRERLREDVELVSANRRDRRFVERQVEHASLHPSRYRTTPCAPWQLGKEPRAGSVETEGGNGTRLHVRLR